jgi:hypothetical protein
VATTTIGSNPGVNDWMFSAAMHECWTGNNNYSITGLGRMIQVDAYCAAASGGGSASPAGWLNTGFTMDDSPAGGIGVGSGTSGTWLTANFKRGGVAGDVPTSSTDTWAFGFWASNGVWCIYHDDGGSTFVKATAGASSTGGTNVNTFSGSGSMSAYGTYFIVHHYVKIGGSMIQKFVDVKSAGTMKLVKVNVKVAGVMKQVAQLNEVPFDPVHAQPVWHEDENGILIPGVVTWEGPLYLGPPGAREFHLHGEKILRPRPYELLVA